MAVLNEKQLDLIYDLLLSNGLSYESLQIDILDHISCMVEEKMDNGMEFRESLSLSTEEFGLSQLSEIQETTLYLLTLKLNKMKKVLGVIAILTSVFVIAGILMKMAHSLGAGLMLFSGFILAAFVVFPGMMYIELKQASSSLQKAATITGYFAGILLSTATLFKFMHWPGFYLLYYGGLGLLVFVFIPLFTFKNYRTNENKMFAVAKSLLIIAGVITIWASYRMSEHARVIVESAQ